MIPPEHGETDSIERRIDALIHLRLPDWHDRPTGPGTWIERIPTGSDDIRTILAHEWSNWQRYANANYSHRWYGPIPPDPKGTP